MKTYPLFKVHVPIDATMSQIREVLESGFINEGTQVTQLTTGLQQKLAAQNLVLVNSCTSALTLALHLAGARQAGAEIVSTPMTCVATNTPVVASGARLVWADVDPDTGMIDVNALAAKVTQHTCAIMAVAWAGAPPDLYRLNYFCKHHNVKLILDAAHAFGATYRGVPIHEWADYTCYSFQAIKHFTTGDGGALVCKNDDDFKRVKALKWFGLDRDRAKDEKGNWKGQQWDVDIEESGYKFNMNNVAAAVGLAQLPHIDNIVLTHQRNAVLYDKLFEDCVSIVPAKRYDGSESSFWVYTAKVVPHRSILQRDQLLAALNAEGIMAGVVHVPNDTYTAFHSSQAELPGVREFAVHQFSLPCGWWLDTQDVEWIAKRVKELTQ